MIAQNTLELNKMFSEAIIGNDIGSIYNLLHENGRFDTQDNDLETVEVNKIQFIDWFSSKLSESKVISVHFDQCLHCKVGNDVLLLNKGKFPRNIKDISERSKTGLMLDYKDGIIATIKFCYVFAETENKFMFELKSLRRSFFLLIKG